MFFSVIVPVYKAEAYLIHCIDSILSQEFSDFELILVDDGSPDLCPIICDQYANSDRRIKVIHQSNRGSVAARLAGAYASIGKYLLFIDSDDFVEKGFFHRLYDNIQHSQPDVLAFGATVICGSKTYRTDNSCKKGLYANDLSAIRKSLMFDPQCQALNFGILLPSLWSKVIDRELLLACAEPVPTGIIKGDDLAVTVPTVCRCKSLAVIEEYGYHYRCTERSLMHSYSSKDIDSLITLANYLLETLGSDYYINICGLIVQMIYEHLRGITRSGCSLKQFWAAYKAIAESSLRRYVKDFHFHGRVADMIKIILIKKFPYGLYPIFRLLKGVAAHE